MSKKITTDSRNKEKAALHKKIVGTILNAIPYTHEAWQKKLSGDSIVASISSISDWKNEKREMKQVYQELLRQCLVEDGDLAPYETKIRSEIVKRLGIFRYQSVFYRLEKMTYSDFLTYVFESLQTEEIYDINICWEEINMTDVFGLLARKINILYYHMGIFAQFPIPEEYGVKEKNTLLLSYSKNINGQQKEYYVLIDWTNRDQIASFCEEHAAYLPDKILHLLFVPHSITDKEYFDALERYRIRPISIDAYDMKTKKIYEVYISERNGSISTDELHFLNTLTDAMIQKILKTQHIILKEIISRNYDLERVSSKYFLSNASIWDYKYPVRKGLAFEKNLLDEILRDKSKVTPLKDLKVLDLNLSGALYGLRISPRVKHVNCFDISSSCIQMLKNVAQAYDERRIYNERKRGKEDKISTTNNISYTLIHPERFTINKEKSFANSFDIIIIGLGGGSYIENSNAFLRTISQWLKPGGCLLFSVYNEDALWWHSLSTENMDFLYDGKHFKHRGGGWDLPVKLYHKEEIQNLVSAHFKIYSYSSYPTVLSVVSDQQDSQVLNYLKRIDGWCAGQKDSLKAPADRGIFHIILATTLSQKGITQCFYDTKNIINNLGISYQSILHEPIVSSASMIRHLNQKGEFIQKNFVKSILLYDRDKKNCFFVLLLLEKQVDRKVISKWYQEHNQKTISPYHIHLLTERQLTELQLASGSVSAFTYPIVKEILETRQPDACKNVFLLYDTAIPSITGNFLYTYSGNLKETWKIDKKMFLQFIKTYGGNPIHLEKKFH